MRSLIYVRTTAADGSGLDHQIEAGRAYARAKGYSVRREVRDVVISRRLVRPGLDELFRLIKRDMIATVIVASPDRLARNTAQRQALEQKIAELGATVEYATVDAEKGLAMLAGDALDPDQDTRL